MCELEEMLFRASRPRSVCSMVYLDDSWRLDAWRKRSVPEIMALVVLITVAKNDVECLKAALASAKGVAQMLSSSDDWFVACCRPSSCGQRRLAVNWHDFGRACNGHSLCFYLSRLRFSELKKGGCKPLSLRVNCFGDSLGRDGAGCFG